MPQHPSDHRVGNASCHAPGRGAGTASAGVPSAAPAVDARGAGDAPEPWRGGEDLLLGMHLSSTTTARHFVTGWAARHHLREDVTDTLELLTSEVVGNAVVHGAGPIRVFISSSPPSRGPEGEAVLVQVHDTSASEPQVQALNPDGTGGRGLAMVELLAQQWGVGRPQGFRAGPGVETGKTVWFLLAP